MTTNKLQVEWDLQDVLFYLPKLLKEFRIIKKEIIRQNPKFCIFIDSHDSTLSRCNEALRLYPEQRAYCLSMICL